MFSIQHGLYTHKHGNKEKLPTNSFILFTSKLVIKKLVRNQSKSRRYCIDKNATVSTYIFGLSISRTAKLIGPKKLGP